MGQLINKTNLTSVDLFLNELSINVQASSISEAEKRLNGLVEIVRKLPKFVNGIKTPSDFYSIEIAKNYRFPNWLSSFSEDDKDLKSLIVSKVSSSPHFEEIIDDNSDERLIEFEYNGLKCIGLGLSSPIMFDTLSISLDDKNWNHELISINASIYEGEDIEKRDIDVKNITNIRHYDIHKKWLEEYIKFNIISGIQLWVKRSEFFPNLSFCESVKNQIEDFTGNDMEFIQIVKQLFELNRYCDTWPDNTPIDSTKFTIKVTPESTTRLAQFETQLTKRCPDGNYRLFSLHARYTPGAGRIHFHEDIQNKKLIIGSIANQNVIK